MCFILKHIRKYIQLSFLSVLMTISLIFTNVYSFVSYADSVSIAEQNPLFIPITSLVTAVALGSGIIAKNSEDAINAANTLVDSVVNNIKSSEVEKSESDAGYDSPYRVINGGQPEKPNNSNKNGKWVALGGGAIASEELWANKEAVMDIMQKINSLGGYNQQTVSSGLVSSDNLMQNGSASNIALQLAKISNSAVKQFDEFLHCEWWNDKDFTYDDCVFNVTLQLSDIYRQEPLYPYMVIMISAVGDKVKYLNLPNSNPFRYYTWNNTYGTLSYYYLNSSTSPIFLDENMVAVPIPWASITVKSRNSTQSFDYSASQISNSNSMVMYVKGSGYPYIGYKWFTENPWQFTNNVYNVNMQFDENFQNWLQGQIQILGQGLMDAVRLGVTVSGPSWNPSQEQIQTGTTPASVIYQYINNYENPGNIPDDEEEPDNPIVVPPAVEEPQPTNDYLGNFLLPESITTKFPFCIPFDIARCLRLFSVSSREAPKWECDLNYGSSTYHVVIDLSMFNDVASFIRPLEYILFLVGLALGTRSLIRG